MTAVTLGITGWSAVSPFGVGRHAFAEGVREQRATAVKLDPEQWHVPDDLACLVPDFVPRTILGRKGTRMMNRVTGLAVTASAELLESDGSPRAASERTGFVLGTTVGSAQSAMDLTRGSLVGKLPYQVESGLIPYAVMNGAAGQCAIRHGLRGPNATVAAGRPSGLAALNYARRLLLTDRADVVLCGAAEEFSEARAWIEHHSRGTAAVLGEGCAVFTVTKDPVRPLAALLAVRTGAFTDGGHRAAVVRCVRQALAHSGVDESAVWTACPSGAAGAEGAGEHAALVELFGQSRTGSPLTELIGETHAASASLQLAALLTRAEDDPDSAGRVAVVTSVDPAGTAAAAVLRLRPGS